MSHVTYELDGKTAVIQMDDGKANALSYEMIDALLAALTRAESEASTNINVLQNLSQPASSSRSAANPISSNRRCRA